MAINVPFSVWKIFVYNRVLYEMIIFMQVDLDIHNMVKRRRKGAKGGGCDLTYNLKLP